MAKAYVEVANLLYERKHLEYAQQVYTLSVEVHANAPAYNRLAYIAYRHGQFEEAVDYWTRSLHIDSTQADIHKNAGQVAAKHLMDKGQALYHLERAMELNPQLEAQVSGWIEKVR